MNPAAETGKGIRRIVKDEAWLLVFAALAASSLPFSGISSVFLAQELLFRFIRYFLPALAFLPPVLAGAGLNFSVMLGLVAGEAGVLAAAFLRIPGASGIFASMIFAAPAAVLFGFLAWRAAVKARGGAMLTSVALAAFASLLFELLTVSAGRAAGGGALPEGITHGLDGLLTIRAGILSLPIATLLFSAIPAGLVFLLLERKGRGRGVRLFAAFTASSVIACLGAIVQAQAAGTFSGSGGRFQTMLVSAAAFVAGGAAAGNLKTLRVAAGVIFFQAFYLLAPLASKSVFGSAMAGEYARFFFACLAVSVAISGFRSRDSFPGRPGSAWGERQVFEKTAKDGNSPRSLL